MKKIFCIILTAIFMLALPVSARAETLSAPAEPVKCVFKSSQFGGKLQEVAYAGAG